MIFLYWLSCSQSRSDWEGELIDAGPCVRSWALKLHNDLILLLGCFFLKKLFIFWVPKQGAKSGVKGILVSERIPDSHKSTQMTQNIEQGTAPIFNDPSPLPFSCSVLHILHFAFQEAWTPDTYPFYLWVSTSSASVFLIPKGGNIFSPLSCFGWPLWRRRAVPSAAEREPQCTQQAPSAPLVPTLIVMVLFDSS